MTKLSVFAKNKFLSSDECYNLCPVSSTCLVVVVILLLFEEHEVDKEEGAKESGFHLNR